ncbi:MAG: hypothetical protein WBD20_20270 [Pirellulaceae bacterium]
MFHRELDDHQLRYFGLSLCGLIMAFAGLAYWKWQASTASGVLCVASVALAVAYYAVPSSQRRIYQGFTWLTRPFQLFATIVILAIVYFVIVTPIGIVLRLRGRSVAKSDADAETFWIRCEDVSKSSRYFDTY